MITPLPAHPTERVASIRFPASRLGLGLLLIIALLAGVLVRGLAYASTYSIRYQLNQQNAFYWGNRIVHGGSMSAGNPSFWQSYLAVYDANEAHPVPEPNQLDYVPLRLLMAGIWVKYLDLHYGPVIAWRPEFARSFCAFSMIMEMCSAVAMFGLVSCWLKQTGTSHANSHAHWNRWQYAAASAILIWLNPASIVDSHVWPHGQTWILPFYLLAILLMLQKRFLLAGVVFGLGAMFKGQMMLVAPLLILWPLFDRHWLASLRVAGGMIGGIASVTWPWICRGSMAWARIGFAAKVGFTDVLRKGDALNLPALLEKYGQMTLHQDVFDFVVFGSRMRIELRSVLLIAYLTLLFCCAWGIARQARFKDRRLLISIAAPWALMFFVLGQMDERYLVWSACFSAAAICINRWAMAVHLILSWAGVATMIEFLLVSQPVVCPHLMQALIALNPLTWLATAAAVIYLMREASTLSPSITASGASPTPAQTLPSHSKSETRQPCLP